MCGTDRTIALALIGLLVLGAAWLLVHPACAQAVMMSFSVEQIVRMCQ